MNEELMVQILVMGGVVATLVLGIAALIKVLKLASAQHRDRLARHQRAQEQLQLDADARRHGGAQRGARAQPRSHQAAHC